MEVKKETICEDTLYIVREYYHLNTEPLFSVLADDCVWLSIGNLLVSGAEAIRAQFKNGFIMPPLEMEEPDFRQIETGSEGQLMVLGEYMLHVSEQAEIIYAGKQRATFCYRQEKDGYRLYHMHVSNEYNELVGDEIFPVQISRQTYQYVQHLLRESGRSNNWRLEIRENGSAGFVDPGLIMYIQAVERECILHLVNEARQVQNPAKELEHKLPLCFYRLHRSYFVNCNYVAKIERYKLTLITGEELPIPKLRYLQIRDDITKIIQNKRL
ncbi:MAG: LytTR family transcriptional regulator DNA-binding domain-containing protein [Eubacteriales bacterium]|nr:LytTR family transcriptional regulator DNA-binding domain-containing protein [Eubacteriales bacterium]